MPNGYKDFQDLTLSDDFMFGQVMGQAKFCKPFLEELLQKKIAKVVLAEKQKDDSDTYGAHGVRYDVYIEDDRRTKYVVEMQTTMRPSLEKRIRYYASDMDRGSLDAGESYADMRDSYVIFICTADYYKAGLALYERESRIKGTEIPYEDGSHVYILNSDYKTGNADKETLRFLDYLKARREGKPFDTSGSEFLTEIDKEIARIKRDEGKEQAYMTFAMRLQDERLEGREEGREEERASVILKMLRKGLSPEEICEFTDFSLEEIESLCHEYDD